MTNLPAEIFLVTWPLLLGVLGSYWGVAAALIGVLLGIASGPLIVHLVERRTEGDHDR